MSACTPCGREDVQARHVRADLYVCRDCAPHYVPGQPYGWCDHCGAPAATTSMHTTARGQLCSTCAERVGVRESAGR